MPYILKLWLKNVPQWAVVFTQLQLVRTLVEQTTLVLDTAISAEGRIKSVNQIITFINIAPIILICIFFSFGCSPVIMYVVNISIFGVLLSFTRVYFMKYHCGMAYSYYLRNILLPIVLTTLPALLCLFLLVNLIEESFVRLVTTVCVSIIVYLLSLYFVGMTKEERTILVQLREKFLKKGYGWKG